MKNRIDAPLICWIATVLAVSLSGCVSWKSTKQSVARNTAADVGPARANRKEALAQDFDHKRNDAQFDAAISCWQRGDVAKCNELLTGLLERNPDDRRARLLLADVYLFNGQTDKSVEELSKVVAADPKNALAQHALAQVFDALGRRSEALSHYEEATRLEPDNEVYSLSYKMATGVIPPTDRNAALAAEKSPLTAAIGPHDSNVAVHPQGSPRDIVSTANQTDSGNLPFNPRPETPQPSNCRNISDGQSVIVDRNVSLASASMEPAYTSHPKVGISAGFDNVRTAPAPVQSVQSAPQVDRQIVASPLERAVEALAAGDTETAVDAASRGLAEHPEQTTALYRVLVPPTIAAANTKRRKPLWRKHFLWTSPTV